MRAIRFVLAVVLCAAAAVRWEPSVTAQAGALTLGLTVNTPTIAPGDTLVAGVTVNNPGNGPLADFYFVILLPDGSTMVSAGPGVGARFGTIGNLRSLVPVARGISLASAFPYQASSFFSYTFSGIEPLGTYRLYFVATRTGAFDDGVINGGDLLAVASRDVVVSSAPPLTTVDVTRQVSASVPPSGGSVQTTTAAGATLRLSVPAGALPATTPISIAPLAAFSDLPLGPLVAGVAAEPSGLQFATPTTLTITLPAGYQIPVVGLSGFIADSSGRNLTTVPITVTGNVVTMQVPHFSVAGVALNNYLLQAACTFGPGGAPPEQVTACASMQPLFQQELARLATQGGNPTDAFKFDVIFELLTWLRNGLGPRLLAAQTADPADPNRRALLVADEWVDWAWIYRPLFGLGDRTNTGVRAAGDEVDDAQAQLRLALLAAMNAVNVRCLADKPRVTDYVRAVLDDRLLWSTQFGAGAPLALPFDEVYCVDIRIDAAPSPALTPGTPSLMPVDLRVRFIDGTDLPGPPLSVVMTATNATVTPAGGTIVSPLSGNVTLLPTAASTTVTITAAFAVDPAFPRFDELPVRTRTFTGGTLPAPSFVFDQAALQVVVHLLGPPNDPGNGVVAQDINTSFENVVPAAAALPETGRPGYTGSGTASATRRVTHTSGSVQLVTTGQVSATIAGAVSGTTSITSAAHDGWRVQLPAPVDMDYSSGPGGFTMTSTQGGHADISVAPLTSGTVRLGQGSWRFLASSEVVQTLTNGTATSNPPLSFSYSVTLRR